MSQDQQPAPTLFTPMDVTTAAHRAHPQVHEHRHDAETTRLLRDILAAHDRQNELLEELVAQLAAGQKQRQQELQQWRSANPELARACGLATEALSHVQAEFLARLTEEVNENPDALADGEFLLTEFVDRFGPRLAHLNGMLQVLAQLSNP